MKIRPAMDRTPPTTASRTLLAALLLAALWTTPATAQVPDGVPGRTVDSLLEYARTNNPEYASMQLEAAAAAERVGPAGTLPDPRFRTELRDITRGGTQDITLAPARVGSTRYLVTQDLPWFGKLDLKREIAEFDADSAKGRSQATWSELAARIKVAFARLYYLQRNERLNREILDLMARLEQVAQSRYAGGLAAQQDVIRAQVEQTAMKNELLALEGELRQTRARLNGLLARPAGATLADPEQLRATPSAAKLDFNALEERVRNRNPQLFAESSKVKAAEKARELAYRNRYPDFTFGISPIQVQSGVREWELMIELNIPLRQESRRSQERESESMLSAARARRDALANQVLADLSESLAAIEAARQSEALATTSLLPQAELTFRSALAGYENGRVDFATLLDAQRQIRQARQSQIRAQSEVQARIAEIERLTGEDL
jgi:cobalt-zinc-cadmium efflux system outer membrane protein